MALSRLAILDLSADSKKALISAAVKVSTTFCSTFGKRYSPNGLFADILLVVLIIRAPDEKLPNDFDVSMQRVCGEAYSSR